MRPATLRRILLIQTLEKADADSEILPATLRGDATREAARSLTRESGDAEKERFFAARAELLVDHLVAHFPFLRSVVPPSHRLRYLVPALLVIAILIGWFTQALGSEKLVNILSFPLLGILGWNFFIYLAETIGGLNRRRHAASSDGSDESSAGFLTRFAEGAESLPAQLGRDDSDPKVPAALRQGLSDFQRRWRRLTEPVVTLRLHGALHLAAALLAIAAVVGMYAKGAANEYRAYWESTFFTSESLQALLGFILGPASAISGIGIPDVTPLHRTADLPLVAGENAAQWIHLYAVTIGLFVVIPRLLLATWHSFQARRSQSAIDPRSLPGAGLYFDRLIAEALGTALITGAVPYCHQLSPTAEATLQRQLERQLGVPVKLDWRPIVKLGSETEAAAQLVTEPEKLPAHLVLCFDFAVTPEEETHGDFIRSTRKAFSEIDSETRLHVCLDAEGFDDARRNLADFADRRQQRLDAWRAVAGPLRDEITVFPALDPAS
ncbi:MAG: DUF2868 domain-containing protein [Verrucomicrobiae bacterium]|nr:DUF2868 domain-containing protein [Verrucomicrobiae bacterium]